MLSPAAAWVSNERLADVPKVQRKKFLPFVPNFVIEVMSPRDTVLAAHAKMKCWIAEGVELRWLIDGDGPVAGYHLPVQKIWDGL